MDPMVQSTRSPVKIVFCPQSCLPFHANSLLERPLGGIETAVIRLAAALDALGHRTIVISQDENPRLSVPLYLPFRALNDIGPMDVFIAVRQWQPLLLRLQSRKRFYWTGDSYDQPQALGLGDRRVAECMNAFLAVSTWHADTMCLASGFPRDKAWPLRNGIHLADFSGTEERSRKRLIYSSTPYRGLNLFLEILPEIRSRHPDVELYVFSGYDVYSAPGGCYDERAENDYRALTAKLSGLPGCHISGNIRQKGLAREFMKSAVLAYPNTFAETSCITAMEAQAAGCAVVSSALGALPETVGEAGLLLSEEPGSPAYIKAFIEALDRVLSDDDLFTRLSQSGRERAQRFDWNIIAREFLDYLAAHHGLNS